jgi:hypothetical protein
MRKITVIPISLQTSRSKCGQLQYKRNTFQYSTAEILTRCLGLIFEVQCNNFGCFSETSKNVIYSRFIKSRRRYDKRILRVICEVGDFDFGDKDSSVLGFMPCIIVNTPQHFEVTTIL